MKINAEDANRWAARLDALARGVQSGNLSPSHVSTQLREMSAEIRSKS